MQHPEREGLVDGNEHDDRGREMSPEIPLEKREKISRDQGDVRHRAEDQRRHQQPERVTESRPRKGVSPERAHGQRDDDRESDDDHRVERVSPEFLLDPCAEISVPGESVAGFGDRADAVKRVAPVGLGEEVALHLERAPDRPDEGASRDHQPEDDESSGEENEAGRSTLCYGGHPSNHLSAEFLPSTDQDRHQQDDDAKDCQQ